MKKSVLLLPIALLVLSACSSDTAAPVESVDGTLSPGVMQPVDGSSGSWEPEIQQAPAINMPTQPVSAPQPVYNPQPVYTPSAPTQPAVNNQSQDFVIPRNAQTNAPDYSKINKGFYKNSTYTVRKGDTMFLIAYIAGIDVQELARMNNMTEPYQLKVGQVMKVSNNAAPSMPVQNQPQATVQPAVTYTPSANGTQYGSDGSMTGPVKASAGGAMPVVSSTVTAGAEPLDRGALTQQSAAVHSSVNWRWPTTGKVIQGFSSADGGNKGIDISGSRGQAVNAAAAGTVVYAGHALRGYGNLIIIKHNDDFLSAYAHNETILVKDQQRVSAGQQIAKMGSSDTSSVRLHFEIRERGKSVDPMRYLPRQ